MEVFGFRKIGWQVRSSRRRPRIRRSCPKADMPTAAVGRWPTRTIARAAALARPDDSNCAPVNADLMVERRDVIADRDGQGFSVSLISDSLWPWQISPSTARPRFRRSFGNTLNREQDVGPRARLALDGIGTPESRSAASDSSILELGRRGQPRLHRACPEVSPLPQSYLAQFDAPSRR